MNALIEQCRRLGVRLRVEGGALAYDGPKGAMTSELAAALKAHKTELLAALAQANPPGISPEFAARLSPEDLADIASGDLAPETVQQYEQAAVAREAENLREFFEERTAIPEHDAGLPRAGGRTGGRPDHGDPGPESGLSVGVPAIGALGIPRSRVPGARHARPGRFPTLRHGHGPRARGRQARTRLAQYEAEIEAARAGPHRGKAGDVHRGA
jgi:hypothetical protein